IILPLGRTSVTTAATLNSIFSERSIEPVPFDDELDSASRLPVPLCWILFQPPRKSKTPEILESWLRSDVLPSVAFSSIEIVTVSTSPTLDARGSPKRLARELSNKDGLELGIEAGKTELVFGGV